MDMRAFKAVTVLLLDIRGLISIDIIKGATESKALTLRITSAKITLLIELSKPETILFANSGVIGVLSSAITSLVATIPHRIV